MPQVPAKITLLQPCGKGACEARDCVEGPTGPARPTGAPAPCLSSGPFNPQKTPPSGSALGSKEGRSVINCREARHRVLAAALGSNPSSVSGAQERWWGRGHGKRDADRRGTLARGPSPGRGRPPRARKTSGRRVLGGAPGTLCDRAPGPREPRWPFSFLPSGPAAPALLEPVADEFPRNKAASLTDSP